MNDQSAPVLRVTDLNVTYGTNHAVRHADLVVRRGERVAVVGESGSGKTSLAGAIAGFLDAGTVEV
ncbi:ATP-binding cassette domain-containing protein, partial [Curtobacterium sp. MCBA15_013]